MPAIGDDKIPMFVDVWIEAHRTNKDTVWIGKQFNLDRRAVLRIGEALRKRGVKLPYLKYHRFDHVDVDALNESIDHQLDGKMIG